MKIFRCAALLALAGVLVLLTPLAHASPPDPSWIHGVYDDGDRDDVVVQITTNAQGVEQVPPVDACSIPLVIAILQQTDEGAAPNEVPTLIHARAPPVF